MAQNAIRTVWRQAPYMFDLISNCISSTAWRASTSTESRPVETCRGYKCAVSLEIPRIARTITSSTSRRIRTGTAG